MCLKYSPKKKRATAAFGNKLCINKCVTNDVHLINNLTNNWNEIEKLSWQTFVSVLWAWEASAHLNSPWRTFVRSVGRTTCQALNGMLLIYQRHRMELCTDALPQGPCVFTKRMANENKSPQTQRRFWSKIITLALNRGDKSNDFVS